MTFKICTYRDQYENAVINLWQEAGLTAPQNDPKKDIQRKVDDSADFFFIGLLNDQVIASVMAGYDGHRGWINYLAVSSEYQRSGYGRKLMAHVEEVLFKIGCPKINLQIRETNKQVINTYKSLGYQVDAVVSMGKRLIPDQ